MSLSTSRTPPKLDQAVPLKPSNCVVSVLNLTVPFNKFTFPVGRSASVPTGNLIAVVLSKLIKSSVSGCKVFVLKLVASNCAVSVPPVKNCKISSSLPGPVSGWMYVSLSTSLTPPKELHALVA